MGRLRVFWPDETAGTAARRRFETDAPRVIPFPRYVSRFQQSETQEPLTRARLLYANRFCAYCGHASVVPLELDDGRPGSDHRTVPGTATLVGFHCESCGAEWPV